MRSGTAFTLDEDVQRMRDEIFLLRLEHAVLVEGKSDEPFWKHLWDKILPGRLKYTPTYIFLRRIRPAKRH
ncbi:MAG: hypothetical protein LH618_02785 [Saprospiraceae bacterium]|nr:hypothetical protein [Saprospiraceae bacterium]